MAQENGISIPRSLALAVALSPLAATLLAFAPPVRSAAMAVAHVPDERRVSALEGDSMKAVRASIDSMRMARMQDTLRQARLEGKVDRVLCFLDPSKRGTPECLGLGR